MLFPTLVTLLKNSSSLNIAQFDFFFTFFPTFFIIIWVFVFSFIIIMVIVTIKNRNKMLRNFSPEQLISFQAKDKIIQKEVVLVICPYCKHRNLQERTKCEQCGASLI